jgi:hypothetical protein
MDNHFENCPMLEPAAFENLGNKCTCSSRMADLLIIIGYPRRGTEEENIDIYDASNMIQKNFSLSELQGFN